MHVMEACMDANITRINCSHIHDSPMHMSRKAHPLVPMSVPSLVPLSPCSQSCSPTMFPCSQWATIHMFFNFGTLKSLEMFNIVSSRTWWRAIGVYYVSSLPRFLHKLPYDLKIWSPWKNVKLNNYIELNFHVCNSIKNLLNKYYIILDVLYIDNFRYSKHI